LVFVDDINLIAADERRLLGRMLRDGTIGRPSQDPSRAIDGELGQILANRHPGRSHPNEIIVVNPFGLAIEDIAIATQVHHYATASGLGTQINR
jgi:N-[(2S)-2-amino-2-carboxyethyl]-L-glutamate dehydrogenase